MRLILLVVAVAVGIGYLAGGSLRGFPGFRLRYGGLAAIGLALQFAPLDGTAATLTLAASLGFLLAFAVLNFRAPGFFLILFGVALNTVAIVSNLGMPVTQRAILRSGQVGTVAELKGDGEAKHHLAGDDTVLVGLVDAIGIPPPIGQAVSVGDLCMHLGVAWFIVVAMRPNREPSIGPLPVIGGIHR